MESEKRMKKRFCVVCCLACALLMLGGCFNVHIDLPQRPTTTTDPYSYQTQPSTTAPAYSQPATTAPPYSQTSTEPSGTQPATTAQAPATTQQPATEATTAAPKTPDQMNTAELLNFFNASLNRVKTDNVGFTKHKVTAVLDLQLSNSLANTLVGLVKNSLLSENGETETVAKGQSGVNVFSPVGKPYVSNLTLNDLTSITCTREGSGYVIRLGVKGETNPAEGSIMSRGFDYMTVDDVVNIYAPKVGATVAREDISVVFSDCTAELHVNADGVISAYTTYVKGVMNMYNASVKKGVTINTDLAVTLASTTDYTGFTY